MTKDEALDRLEEAELGPSLYRTARRILDRVSEADGRCDIDLATAKWICGKQDAFRNLTALAATGLIRLQWTFCGGNEAIRIDWCGCSDEQQAPGDRP